MKIESLEHLKRESENGAEFYILLGSKGIYRSSKWIVWDDVEQKYFIRNFIDETEQELTEKQLMNRKWTNIGYAMIKGALYKDD